MYQQKKNSHLVSKDGKPELIPSEEFDRVLSTIPAGYPVQLPIIKFGLLMEHLEPAADNVHISIADEEIESSSTVVALPETLSQIKYLVKNHSDHLDRTQKRRAGRLCQNANLDLANELGASKSELKRSIREDDNKRFSNITYVCEYCGKEFDSELSRNGHLGTCGPESDESNSESSDTYTCVYCDKDFDYEKSKEMHMRKCDKNPNDSDTSDSSSSEKRPALGKEIKKDRGSERVSGRNPFADPGRLKDTGLHQGGGD